ncbi:MAG: glycosyltransferase family 2 protein [Thermoleophilia bacterium]|nr:glycosyltransferase family 2 protein [Thermoleophilia bacterium]MDH4344943.1 glycosyltransferase family 2 protein [Thermoleophilia bacterium]MDH5332407.1 glycosyltransferase family 2 protein [Thermoleophilia bacterium]
MVSSRTPAMVLAPLAAVAAGRKARRPPESCGDDVPAKLSILMPVYDELATVEAAIDDALTAELPVESRELVIVDDGSTDGTRELLTGRDWPSNVTVVLHERNRGKGAALRTALQHATGELAAVLDADLEYAAADLGVVLEPLLAGDANVVFGTRAWTSQSAFSFWYVVGNKAVTFATNVLYNCWISDVMTCHKAMRTDLFRSLDLRERGFAIEPEIAARVLRSGERIHEVPISYKARGREAGKKLTALDGLRVLRTLVRCRLA